MRNLTPEEKAEFERLTAQSKKIEKDIQALVNKPVIYGYVRVSTKLQAKDGNSLEAQEQAVRAAGATEIYPDTYSGKTNDRPKLQELLKVVKPGDTIIVTKLDRIGRSVQQGIDLIDGLLTQGINIHVLNMGRMDNTPTGKLIRNVMLCFAEFEREMIMQRTREGREIARLSPTHREGRKPKYSEEQMVLALKLLESNSYSDVIKMTGISKATLIRAKKEAAGLRKKIKR